VRTWQDERLLLFRYIANWLTDTMCGRSSMEDIRVDGLKHMQGMIDAGVCEHNQLLASCRAPSYLSVQYHLS
jgi:hypothetical protein